LNLLEASRSVLVVVDLQGKLMEQIWRPQLVVEVVRRMLRLAELFQVPVLLTEQYPRGLGPTHPEIRESFESLGVPRREVEKTSFGCFGEPSFQAALDELRPDVPAEARQLVVVGIEAHVCVMQTVLEGLRLGREIHVVWDGVSGRGQEYRKWALERMLAAGAVITNHESVGFEWARDKNHERFREMSRLYKEGQPSA